MSHIPQDAARRLVDKLGPVHIEMVAEVREGDDGPTLDWTVEGGIHALPVGCVLLVADKAITDDTGSGEVWTSHTPAAAPSGEAVATVSECEACFTPDACRLRGTCDHYAASKLRIAAAPSAPAPAEVPMPVKYQRIGACTCQGPDGPCGDCQSAQADYEEWLDDPQVTPRELRAYAAAREAAERERVRGVLEAAQNDAMRFRWLTEDHADPETRAKCRELLSRMGVMTYSAACTDIDSAMAQATKREMLRTAGEWQRRYEPTCAHGRYSDEDCTDCPRTAAAARAELGEVSRGDEDGAFAA